MCGVERCADCNRNLINCHQNMNRTQAKDRDHLKKCPNNFVDEGYMKSGGWFSRLCRKVPSGYNCPTEKDVDYYKPYSTRLVRKTSKPYMTSCRLWCKSKAAYFTYKKHWNWKNCICKHSKGIRISKDREDYVSGQTVC